MTTLPAPEPIMAPPVDPSAAAAERIDISAVMDAGRLGAAPKRDFTELNAVFTAAHQRVAAGQGSAAYRDLITVVSSAPFHAAAWYDLGAVLHVARKWAASTAAFQRAAAILAAGRGAETVANAWHCTNIGWNLHLADRTDEAERWLRLAIAKDSRVALAHSNLAMVLVAQGKLDEALAEARTGVSLGDTTPAHQMALAFVLFARGDWAGGMAAFESRVRFKFPEFDGYPMPRWRGQPVARLFIQAEQGYGDTIWLLRWAWEAAKRVTQITLYVQKELKSLLAINVPHNVEVVPLPRPLPVADAFLPMMSLPVALGYTTEELLRPCPAYIGLPKVTAASLVIEGDRSILPGARPSRQRQWPPRAVAICWAGSADHDMDRHRSLPLAAMVPLLDLPLEWLSMQVGPRAADLEAAGAYGLIADMSPELLTFEDSARILDERVDLVITADTSLAHLAGAMGLPVWMLVGAKGTDWRWDREGETTQWYPSMRLVRQHDGETWAATVLRVRAELAALAADMGGTDGGAG